MKVGGSKCHRWRRWLIATLGAAGAGRLLVAATVAIRDLSFLEDGGATLKATFYRPAGKGPFPLLVHVHGGAWTMGDRGAAAPLAGYLAAHGVGVLAIDFRMPPVAVYPGSVTDVNYAVRWAKAHAKQLVTLPGWVGLSGDSSGGHQALLVAMRPRDARYARISFTGAAAGDASVSYVVSLWGIVDPLARYQAAVAKGASALVNAHQAFWSGGEIEMSEGSPQLMLERGEQLAMPKLLMIQGTGDQNIDFHIAERFADTYRKAGGAVELHVYTDAPHAFIRTPFDVNSLDALDRVLRFVHAQRH